MHLVYILHSFKLNRFYIGFTSDFDTRMEFHKNAESHKFTANAEDWVLFLKIECESKSQGLDIEKHIKKMKSKTYVENLIKYPNIILKLKEKYK
ncbi:GIY-YIG nuclease family protein [Flavobacterium defluvii]|uniref:Putative endonuclease n=1 Tax=Flavobacterium defluvii TaxID=370979 RepID=A0A1M5G8M7_9FLAO|nr:GIY-YIG nuclease family protein [Flavobacterium defluvii]SHG00095.1 putative endonuclease [Flavobacterium defluvii]